MKLTLNNIKYSYLREIREIHIFRSFKRVFFTQQSVMTASYLIKHSCLREIREIRIFRYSFQRVLSCMNFTSSQCLMHFFSISKIFSPHGKDGFYGFNGEPPEVMINLALGKPLFADINLRLTSLHTVQEQAFLSMAVPLTRNVFGGKRSYLFVVFSKRSENVLFSFFLHKTTRRYSYRKIFAVLSIILKLAKRGTEFLGNDHHHLHPHPHHHHHRRHHHHYLQHHHHYYYYQITT